MALCLTHAGAGYLVYEAMRPAGRHRVGLLATAVVLANAPDLDFLPGLVTGAPTVFHRGFTHTVAGVALVGLAAWWCARRVRPREWSPARTAVFASLAFGSHLLVDYFTVDGVAPYGARFLWPFSDAHLHAPVQAFGEIIVDRSGTPAFLASLWAPHTYQAWAREVLTGLVFFLVGGAARVRQGRRRTSRALPS